MNQTDTCLIEHYSRFIFLLNVLRFAVILLLCVRFRITLVNIGLLKHIYWKTSPVLLWQCHLSAKTAVQEYQ